METLCTFCYVLLWTWKCSNKEGLFIVGGESIHWACYYHVLKQDTATLKIKIKTEVTEYGYYPPKWSIWKYIKQIISIAYLGKKIIDRGAQVAQRLSVCLWLRAWSRCYGIEPHIRLLRYEPASSSPTPPACVPYLTGCLYLCRINK